METFTMSRKEVPRAGLVKAALAGKITNQEGARALRLTVRQFKRLKARFRRQGLRGLVHRRRGQPSPRQLPAALRAQVVTLMTTTYAGFNDVHLTEKLQQVHALPVSRATVRRIRRALGRPPQRPRRAPQHRSRRPRAPAMGQLVQLDASPFPWLEDRGPTAALHGLIDDATSIPLALGAAAEPTPAWRPAPRDLERLLSCRYTRVVARDNTVRLGARWLQIPPGPRGRSYAGCRVEARELLDGRLVVLYQNTLLATQPAPAPTFVLSPRSDPGRDRQRAQHQQRARGTQLQTAVAALAHTLRARRTPAALSVGTDGERPGAAEPHDLVRGGYVGIPRRGPNPGAPGDPSRRAPAPRHPWRTTFSPRQRRLNAAKRG